MSESRDIELKPIVDAWAEPISWWWGPSDPARLRAHQECRDLGYPFAADPSQQLASVAGDQIKQLVVGRAYLFTNTYDARPARTKDRLGREDILRGVDVSVMTGAPRG